MKKAAQALLEIALCVVLSFQVLLKTLLGVIIFAADDFCNLIEADPARVQEDLGGYLAHQLLVCALKSLLNGLEEGLGLDVGLLCDASSLVFLG